MNVKILSHTKNPEETIATAAKLCYSQHNTEEILKGLTSEEVERFTGMLANLSHFSPFEHVSFTFAIEGVSRSLTHQLVRHRIASYSQKSQRYVAEDSFEAIKPDRIANSQTATRRFNDCMDSITKNYAEIKYTLLRDMAVDYCMKNKIGYPKCFAEEFCDWFKKNYPKEHSKFEKLANEDARAILPNACETKIVVTMNARALFNFFAHRCCDRAQTEIRQMAKEMLKQVKDIAPNLFKNAGAPCMSGICPEGAMQCDRLKGKVPTKKDVKALIKEHYGKTS